MDVKIMQKKKKIKIKWFNIIILSTIMAAIIIIILLSLKTVKWKIDSNRLKEQINNINEIIKPVDIKDTNETEIIKPTEEIKKDNPYLDYIKMNMIDVNFEELKKINSDVKGWIKVNGTNVNYPFVQTSDNKYYLTHTFNKSYNQAGWVFQDYRNKEDNKHTILYAHGRSDKTMFGSLKDILTNDWLKNKNNFVIKMSTLEENTLWQIFSIYRIPTTSDYLQIDFKNDDNFLEFTNMLKNRSSYNFNTNVSKNDKILTLSTCYNNKEKMVIHAKLIKKEMKV